MKPLVTIIVLSYKNMEHLNECLYSIFSQTYDNIELIISNDGSEDFDEDQVRAFTSDKTTDHIQNIIINKNMYNMGTVKHCNRTLDLSSGDYILFISCDDAFNNDNAIKDMVEGFQNAPPDVMSIACQTEMRNEDLSVCIAYYVSKQTQRLIKELSPYELYRNHMVLAALMPAASRMYRKECFEKYGRFDESYFLIEDWTLSLSYAKQGVKTAYLDISAVNHRTGGVSHSEWVKESFAQKMYALDMLQIMENALMDNCIEHYVLDEINLKRDWYMRMLHQVWGTEKLPVDALESLNVGAYLANHWLSEPNSGDIKL